MTNLRIAAYLVCNALTLIFSLGFVVALVHALIQGFGTGAWFATRLADFLLEPSSGNAGSDAAIDWLWRTWIGWPLLALAALAVGLTFALALSLGDEPDR